MACTIPAPSELRPAEEKRWIFPKALQGGDLMGFYSDLMGFYSDLMGFYSDLMGFNGIL